MPRLLPLLLVIAVLQSPASLLAEDIAFPPGSVVDITKEPYQAVADGKTDCTAAFQAALNNHVNLIYIPNGTYIIRDTLKWGPGQSRQCLQGQSRDGTILRLADACDGFTSPTRPKAMIWTGKAPAQRFRNAIRNLTVDSGTGNPGAIGVQFIANNQGCMEHVTIRSGDPGRRGVIGLDLGYTNEQGPCLISGIRVIGFECGVSTRYGVDSVTFEHLTLEQQREVGFRNSGQCISLRGLVSSNAVTAYENLTPSSQTVLLDAKLTGTDGAASVPAILNEAGMLARNVRTSGYRQAIASRGRGNEGVTGMEVAEWVSDPALSLFLSPPKTMNLPIEETPEVPWEDPAKWVNVVDFKEDAVPIEVGEDKRKKTLMDWAPAIQKAIDSGARTIYFPKGPEIGIFSNVHLRGNVERLFGMERNLEKPPAKTNTKGRLPPPSPYWPTFILEDGAAPVVVIERFDLSYSGTSFRQSSKRSLVLRSLFINDVKVDAGGGKVFIEDIVARNLEVGAGAKVWARQLNLENWAEPKSHNMGGDLWVLGIKTETDTTPHKVSAGGRSEILGGFIYANKASIDPKQMFINDGGSLVASVGEAVGRNAPFNICVETRDGVTRTLLKGQAYRRGGGASVPLYTGYRNPAKEVPAAPGGLKAEPVGTSGLGVAWQHDGARTDGFRVSAWAEGKEVAGLTVGAEARTAILRRGLLSDRTWEIRVSAFNGAGETAGPPLAARTAPGAPPGTGSGLSATYFASPDLENAKATRTDPALAFDWSASAPAPGVDAKSFGVRWRGQLEARYSETHRLAVEAEGGIRLWVDGRLIIDAWGQTKGDSAEVDLEAGRRVDLRLEYARRKGPAALKLLWSGPNTPKEPIPTSQLHPDARPLPTITAVEERLQAAENAPPVTLKFLRKGEDLSQELLVPVAAGGSAVEDRDFTLSSSELVFAAGAPSAELVVELIDNAQGNPAPTLTLRPELGAGYLLAGTWPSITIADDDMPPPGNGSGLRGAYFQDTELKTLVGERVDPVIGFAWDKGKPFPGVDAKDYSVRWSGFILPLFSETYGFEVAMGAYGGMRLTVDGKLLIDSWEKRRVKKEAAVTKGEIALEAGRRVPIILEFVHRNEYGASARLLWSSPSQYQQVVPQSQLFPADATAPAAK